MNKLLASVAAAAILVSTAAFAEPDTAGTAANDSVAAEAAPAKGDAAPAVKKHTGKHKAHKKGHKKAKAAADATAK